MRKAFVLYILKYVIISFFYRAKRRNLRNPPASGSVKSSGTAKSSGSKRVTNKSNIHRLHDNDSDSDDLNTYNGNSTEQL